MSDKTGYSPQQEAALLKYQDQGDGTYAEIIALAAGTVEIGEVSIDQDVPGSTNAVSIAQIGATTVSTGTGAQGAGSQRVTVAVDSATVAGSATLPAGSNIIGNVRVDQTTPGTTNGVQVNAALPAGTNAIGSTKDNGPAWVVVQTTTNSADMTTAAAISAAPTSTFKVNADDIIIFSDTAMSFKLQEETTETVLAIVYLAANGSAQVTLRNGLRVPTADKKLFGKASVPGNVSVLVSQHSI